MAEEHARFMDCAIELGRTNPAAPFAAILVRTGTGEVLARGLNAVAQSPTRHGEMVALDAWAAAGGVRDERGLALYTTAEPCPMCMAAALWAAVDLVVYGTCIPFLVQHGWKQIQIRAAEIARRTPFAQCRVVGGIREAECDRLFSRRERRPA